MGVFIIRGGVQNDNASKTSNAAARKKSIEAVAQYCIKDFGVFMNQERSPPADPGKRHPEQTKKS